MLENVKTWCQDIEESALRQIENLTKLPFLHKHIAIMPDCHCGYGMPIGAVIATKNAIIPNAVGVDIGCGMLAVKTSLKEITKEELKKLFGGSKEYKGGIRSNIPVGMNWCNKKVEHLIEPIDCIICKREFEKSKSQCGSLGGGNHFIEIQKGNDGYIWFMLHSGSRNLGKEVAEYYDKIAKELNKKYYSIVDEKWDLAFLNVNSKEGQDYINEMNYCLYFALENRKEMSRKIKEEFKNIFNDIEFLEEVNINHNFARLENHFRENVWVHRKGATSAKEEEIGIIPGSQGTKSYIVKGKGNLNSFTSCSHGAGRVMSRIKSQTNLDLQKEINLLNEKGIIHSIRNKKDLDEAPSCYKDIDVVIEAQKDLIEVLVELSPLAVIKG